MMSVTIEIRHETGGDASAIRAVTQAAFAGAEHSSGSEGAIIDALRHAGVLTLSLVAEAEGEIVGHLAFSPVMVAGRPEQWFGLGPVSVAPGRQGRGIGTLLVETGLDLLRKMGAKGCVVMGDPGFYQRFGFRREPGLWYEGVPPEYFMAQAFDTSAPPHGPVTYHPAFDAV